MKIRRVSAALLFLAATAFALGIHFYYVKYYVSAHPTSFISLRPIPAFPGDRKAWVETRKEEATQESHERLVVEAAFIRIHSTPTFLALCVSNNLVYEGMTWQQLSRAKEKAFWLGCILPLLIFVGPALFFLLSCLHSKKTETGRLNS